MAESANNSPETPLIRKEDAVARVTEWLKRTFVEKEGPTISREEVYEDYLRLCKDQNMESTNNAAFGKLFKKVFPGAGARRLGQRRKNKMHYLNIEWRKNLDEAEVIKIEATTSAPEEASRAHKQKEQLVWVVEQQSEITGEKRRRRRRGREGSETSSPQASVGGKEKKAQPKSEPTSSSPSTRNSPELGQTPIQNDIINVDDEDDERRETERQRHGEAEKESEEDKERKRQQKAMLREEERRRDAERSESELTQWMSGGGAAFTLPDKKSRDGAAEELCIVSRHGSQQEEEHETEEDAERIAQLLHWYMAKNGNHAAPAWAGPMSERAQQHSARESWAVGAHFSLMSTVGQCSSTYRREVWGIAPVNPLCLKYNSLAWLLTTTDGREDVSSFALSAYIMLTISSFLSGHLDASIQFFHQARRQLGSMFDVSDYDVAAALVPLAWWSRFYSSGEAEGRKKEVYYATLGANICESVGAINDETYEGHIRLLSVHEMKSPEARLAQAREREPYKNRWKKSTKYARHSDGELHDKIGNIYGIVLHSYKTCTAGPVTADERKGIVKALYQQLAECQDIMRTLHSFKVQGMPATQTYNMILCYGLGFITLIHWLLQSPQQIESARELVMQVVAMDKPMMIIAMHELASNDALLLRNAVDILARHREARLLRLFLDTLAPYASRFYWMGTTHILVADALDQVTAAQQQQHLRTLYHRQQQQQQCTRHHLLPSSPCVSSPYSSGPSPSSFPSPPPPSPLESVVFRQLPMNLERNSGPAWAWVNPNEYPQQQQQQQQQAVAHTHRVGYSVLPALPCPLTPVEADLEHYRAPHPVQHHAYNVYTEPGRLRQHQHQYQNQHQHHQQDQLSPRLPFLLPERGISSLTSASLRSTLLPSPSPRYLLSSSSVPLTHHLHESDIDPRLPLSSSGSLLSPLSTATEVCGGSELYEPDRGHHQPLLYPHTGEETKDDGEREVDLDPEFLQSSSSSTALFPSFSLASSGSIPTHHSKDSSDPLHSPALEDENCSVNVDAFLA